MARPTLLTLNTGSSSLKFSLFNLLHESNLELIISGQISDIYAQAKLIIKNHQLLNCDDQLIENITNNFSRDEAHEQALNFLLNWLKQYLTDYEIQAVGHRIVHGGELFFAPAIVNKNIIQQLKKYIPLAPLHQPYNLLGIEMLNKQLPDLFQVACFDTAFHITQSEIAQAYALPEHITDIPIKRYGFHGLSYEYIAQVLPKCMGENEAQKKIIIAHLGHGASLCAIKNNKSIVTTMGLTALEGLPMGTRCGSIDPGVILYLLDKGMSIHEITNLLYNHSGLLGVSNLSSDIRILLNDSGKNAKRAIDIFVYRIQREIGSLAAALEGIDHLIFTGGIGEHSAAIRLQVCEKLKWLDVEIDPIKNLQHSTTISSINSHTGVWVIPTNEELIIAQHTKHLWDEQLKK